jgi:hypothetical protein
MSAILSILALARAGATSRAWESYITAGLDSITTDAKILTLKGRLLKDQARKETGEAQSRLFMRSAQAYADAWALGPDSYPLINAASMSLFAGQTGNMATLAQQVLALLQTDIGGGETPYWHEATKAEAHLLLGDIDDAQSAFSDAISHAPHAWEDHATTLRQFRQILRYQNKEDGWLAEYAPPKSVYFKGLIGLAADDQKASRAIAEVVASGGVGFGYGALAAGADILIAEALVRDGGELNVILPTIPSVFRAQSVEPYGAEWVARFDILFENAASVEIVGEAEALCKAGIIMAAQVAKGRAIDRAARLESEAIGIEVADSLPKIDDPGYEQILILPRTAVYASQDAVPDLRSVTLAATDVDAAGWERADGHYRAAFDNVVEANRAIADLRGDNPDARVAIGQFINTGDAASQQRNESRITRILRTAALGTTVTNGAAAMMLKAEYPELWVESLGELPESSGAIELYAIGPTC